MSRRHRIPSINYACFFRFLSLAFSGASFFFLFRPTLFSLFLSFFFFISNDRVMLRHWRRGGDAKPRCIARRWGTRTRKRHAGSAHGAAKGARRGKAVLWPETRPARRQFFGRNRSRTPGIFAGEPTRYHTLASPDTTDASTCLSMLTYIVRAVKFPSINVKRCNRVLVDRSSITEKPGHPPPWKIARSLPIVVYAPTRVPRCFHSRLFLLRSSARKTINVHRDL